MVVCEVLCSFCFSSLRLWDVNETKKHFQIMKAKDKQGKVVADTSTRLL